MSAVGQKGPELLGAACPFFPQKGSVKRANRASTSSFENVWRSLARPSLLAVKEVHDDFRFGSARHAVGYRPGGARACAVRGANAAAVLAGAGSAHRCE